MMSELIVLLGEGNYSFAIELAQLLRECKLLNGQYELLASDLSPPLPQDHKAERNIRKLIIEYGVRVWTDVDARNLHHHPRLIPDLKSASNNQIKRVHFIFNFPHVQTPKMRIELNRTLLKDTFHSIEELAINCQVEVLVYISLCYGQSGLNQIEPANRHRSWPDSWQLTEMASYGNFVLVNICPSFSYESFKTLFCDNVANQKCVFESNYHYHYKKMATNQQNKENLLLSRSSYDNNEDVINEELNEQFKNYNPFGYRKQSKPFKTSQSEQSRKCKLTFEGGNIFVFEHRPFKLNGINTVSARIVYTHPFSSNLLVQQFIDEIKELLLDNVSGWRSNVKPFLVERRPIGSHDGSHQEQSTEPLDVYVLAITLNDNNNQNQQNEFKRLASLIGRYLKPTFVEDFLTEQLQIDDIDFGYWDYARDHDHDDDDSGKGQKAEERVCSLNLLVANCLRIKWNISDVRILYSKYCHIIENPLNASNDQQKIASTGSLYPQTFLRDLSFWWQDTSNGEVSTEDNKPANLFQQDEFYRLVWDHLQPTNLRSIHLKEKYIKCIRPVMLVSYCYRLTLQSVDRALDRHKVHCLMETLALHLTKHFPQIKWRS